MAGNDAIPVCVDDVTLEYLNTKLKNFQKISKVEFHTPKTHGGMSKVSKAILQYKEQDESNDLISPASIFLKFSSKAQENFLNKTEGSDIMRHGCLYKREIMLNNYFKHFTLTPDIYFTDIDDSQNFIMLMEDCAALDDVKTGIENSVQKEISIDKAKIAIKEIAVFQSEFYHKNDKSRLSQTDGILSGNKDKVFAEKELSFVPELFSFSYYTTFFAEFSSFKGEKEEFGKFNEENLQRICDYYEKKFDIAMEFMMTLDLERLNTDKVQFNLLEKVKKIKNSERKFSDRFKCAMKYLMEEAPLTLVHNDFRSDNMCFVNNKMKLFDWQCVVVGSGLVDVVSLLFNSIPAQEVNLHEKDLLAIYYETATEKNPDVWSSFDEFMENFKHAVYYKFTDILLFSETISNLPKDFQVIGVSYDSLLSMYLRGLARIVDTVGRHCY